MSSTSRIVVTGATGHLGRLTLEALLERGVAPARLIATGRATDRLADLAARGVTVRASNYDDAASLRAAFAGADALVLVSATEFGKRFAQHRNAIDAAKAVGVQRIVYTSLANAGRSRISIAGEHRDTEAYLQASGLAVTILRNSWYHENYTDRIAGTLEQGALMGSAGDGRIHGATRADYAAAAAVVATTAGHDGRTYELGGDAGYTMAEYAAELAKQAGRAIAYHDLPLAEYQKALVGYGVPEPVAAAYASFDEGIAAGDLVVTSGDLARLLGRPATPLRDAVATALAPVARS